MGAVGGKLKRKGIYEWIYVYLQLTHFVVLQKPTQYCKAILLQLKIFFLKRYLHKLKRIDNLRISSLAVFLSSSCQLWTKANC